MDAVMIVLAGFVGGLVGGAIRDWEWRANARKPHCLVWPDQKFKVVRVDSPESWRNAIVELEKHQGLLARLIAERKERNEIIRRGSRGNPKHRS